MTAAKSKNQALIDYLMAMADLVKVVTADNETLRNHVLTELQNDGILLTAWMPDTGHFEISLGNREGEPEQIFVTIPAKKQSASLIN